MKFTYDSEKKNAGNYVVFLKFITKCLKFGFHLEVKNQTKLQNE